MPHRPPARSARSGCALLIVARAQGRADRRPRRVGARLRGARDLPRPARPPPCARRRGRVRRDRRAASAAGSSCACPGCSRSRRSPACPRASRCTSARRRRTCCCRSTASSRSRRSRSRGSCSATAARARARPARVAARAFVAWEGVSILWSKDVRQGAIELLFFVLPFGLLAVVLARLVWSRAWVLTLYVQLAVMGARVRRDRDRPVRDAQHLLEPEGASRQRVRAERLVLPGQLRLLRPVDLRAVPRRRASSRAS